MITDCKIYPFLNWFWLKGEIRNTLKVVPMMQKVHLRAPDLKTPSALFIFGVSWRPETFIIWPNIEIYYHKYIAPQSCRFDFLKFEGYHLLNDYFLRMKEKWPHKPLIKIVKMYKFQIIRTTQLWSIAWRIIHMIIM